MPALRNKDIRRLDVAMDNSAGVGSIECVRDLNTHLQQLLNLERPALDLVLEGGAIQILHGDEGLPLLLADVINGADVGMVQSRGRLGLPLKAGQSLGVAGDVIGQELECHKTMKASVFSFVYHSHPPATDLLDNAVVGDGLADHVLTEHGLGDHVRRSHSGDRFFEIIFRDHVFAIVFFAICESGYVRRDVKASQRGEG